MDTVSRGTRSRIMASVRQRDTGPEILLRSALHKSGLRYRVHVKELPGTPDLVFPSFRAVIFVHGCYWHDHGCYKSTRPKSHREFWDAKFHANRTRDQRNINRLRDYLWRVMVIWECALLGKSAIPLPEMVDCVRAWLTGSQDRGEIAGSEFQDTLTLIEHRDTDLTSRVVKVS